MKGNPCSAVCVKCLGTLGPSHDALDPVLPLGDPGVDPGDIGLGAPEAVADHADHGVAAAALGDHQGAARVSLTRVTPRVHRANVDTDINIRNLFLNLKNVYLDTSLPYFDLQKSLVVTLTSTSLRTEERLPWKEVVPHPLTVAVWSS